MSYETFIDDLLLDTFDCSKYRLVVNQGIQYLWNTGYLDRILAEGTKIHAGSNIRTQVYTALKSFIVVGNTIGDARIRIHKDDRVTVMFYYGTLLAITNKENK